MICLGSPNKSLPQKSLLKREISKRNINDNNTGNNINNRGKNVHCTFRIHNRELKHARS